MRIAIVASTPVLGTGRSARPSLLTAPCTDHCCDRCCAAAARSGCRCLRVGQVVQVTYDPHDVTNVRLAGYTDRPLGLVFTLAGSAAALTLTGWIVLDLRRGFRSAVEDAASHAVKQQGVLERAAARKRKAERRASTRRGDWWRQLKPAARRAGRRTDWPRSYRGRHRT